MRNLPRMNSMGGRSNSREFKIAPAKQKKVLHVRARQACESKERNEHTNKRSSSGSCKILARPGFEMFAWPPLSLLEELKMFIYLASVL